MLEGSAVRVDAIWKANSTWMRIEGDRCKIEGNVCVHGSVSARRGIVMLHGWWGGAGVKVEAGYAEDHVGVVMDLAVESSWTEGAEGVAGMYHGV